MNERHCDECGASLREDKVCWDYAEQMVTWDFEDFLGAGQVHHLTVLCYHLQHPHMYSKRGLEDAKLFLKDIIENDLSSDQQYARNRKTLDSSSRDWKITGSPEDRGSYSSLIPWSITAADIVAGGVDGYPNRVREWGRSIYSLLKAAQEL